jgi:hypothetical protein
MLALEMSRSILASNISRGILALNMSRGMLALKITIGISALNICRSSLYRWNIGDGSNVFMFANWRWSSHGYRKSLV